MKLRLHINKKSIRRIVQIFFFVLIGAIAVNKALTDSGMGISFLSDASLHALCPFGGVVTLYNLVTLGTFIQKIHMSSIILMSIVFLLAILFGPVFCGWVCPLGSVQEWIGKIGKKVFRKKYNHFIPSKINRFLSYLRYVVLIWSIYITARSGYLIFADYDPYNTLFTFWSEEVALPSVVILLVTLVASLFVERPWCRYACPYGALLGLFNKIRIFKIRRNENTCISCGKCNRACPMNISISNQKAVTDTLCISCYECTSERQCPVPDTLDMKKGKKVTMPVMAVLILVIFFGGIAATIAADLWTTSSDKIPAKYKDGEVAGSYDPADIRGSYTFSDVSTAFEIDLEILYQAFGLPETTDGTTFRTSDLEGIYGDLSIENESVQVFVALYKDLPIVLEDTYLPNRAVDLILEHNPNITQEQTDYLLDHQVDLDEITVAPEEETPSVDTEEPDAAQEEEKEQLVNGTATFQEILNAGITKEQIEAILGGDLPPTNQTVKDYCTQEGLSFSEIKDQINQLAE